MKLARALAAVCLLWTTQAWAALPNIIPTSELTRGMKGYGLTVFEDEKIERFDVEVIGVLPFADLEDEWILMRITSGPVFERKSGVVGGMSGSPIFFGNRLAGAVAFGYPSPRESICFVQPIGQMLRAFDTASTPAALVANLPGTTHRLERPMDILGQRVDRVRIASSGSTQSAGELLAAPLATPLAISGVGLGHSDALAKSLAPYGLELQAMPGGRGEGTIDWQPGAAIGVMLADGDIRAAGTGTLTWRDGDRVLAFGHPMNQRGRVRMPLCGARIIDFFNGIVRSDKVSATLDPCGTLDADTRWGIAGRLGDSPPMTPVRVTIADPAAGWRRTFNFSVVDDVRLAPVLAFNLATALVDGQCGEVVQTAFKATSEVRYANYEPIRRVRRGYVGAGAMVPAVSDLMSSVQVALNPAYDDVRLAGVDFEVELQREDLTARMVRARFANQQLKPGETLRCQIDLRRRSDGSVQTADLAIPIAPTAKPGRYRLAVSGGAQAPGLDEALGTTPVPLSTTAQLIRRLNERPDDDQALVAKLVIGGSDLGLRGHELPAAPSHIEQMLARAMTSDLDRTNACTTVRQQVGLLVVNALTADVTVLDPLTGEPPKVGGQGGEGQQGGSGGGNGAQAASVRYVEALPEPTGSGPLASFDRTAPWLRAEWGQPVSLELGAGLVQIGADVPPAKPGAASESEKPKTDAAKPEEKAEDKTPAAARGPKTWTLTTATEFGAGETHGVALTPQGTLHLGVGAERAADWPEPVLLSIDVDRAGSAWVGSGTTGQLLHLVEGRLVEAWHGDDPLITAVSSSGGSVLFAGAPSGKVRRLTGEQAAEVADAGAAYVWAMRPSAEGSTLLATGAPAKLLRLKGAELSPVAPVEVEHLLCLAEAADGTIYAGGGLPGRLYRVRDSRAEVIATTADAVTSVALTVGGAVAFGHGNNLSIIDAAGGRRNLAAFPGLRVLSVLPSPEGLMVATGLRANGDSVLWRVNQATGDAEAVFDSKLTALAALCPLTGGDLLATSVAPARVYRIGLPVGKEGEYLSPILDATARARWGRFALAQADGAPRTVRVEARSGDTGLPNDDWSPWSAVVDKPTCPPARYFQYRLTLASEGEVSPQVESTSLAYALINTAPEVVLEAPVGGIAFRTKFDVKWKATDAEGDQVHSAVAVKPADHGDWNTIEPQLALGTLQYSLDPAARNLPDGAYRVRITVDDVAFNPTDPKQGEVISEPFWIDTTAPRATLPEQLLDGQAVSFSLQVVDNQRLASAEVRVDGGPWRAAVAEDGLIDSAVEQIVVRYKPVTAGKHKVELRLKDWAGNELLLNREVDS